MWHPEGRGLWSVALLSHFPFLLGLDQASRQPQILVPSPKWFLRGARWVHREFCLPPVSCLRTFHRAPPLVESAMAGKKPAAGAGKGAEPARKPAAKPETSGGSAALPTDTSVFEFGSAAVNPGQSTLAGYCPVSDDLEACRWEILPGGGTEAPQFRIIF